MEHTGTTAIEKSITAAVAKPSPILEGLTLESAPPLKGYVKFVAKPGADTILTVDVKKEPLLTVWQSGLGRSAVFASDAKSRWAEKWVSWNGFDRFWVNLFRDLLPHAQPGEATTSYDPAAGNLVVDYKMAPKPAIRGNHPTSSSSAHTITSSRCPCERLPRDSTAASSISALYRASSESVLWRTRGFSPRRDSIGPKKNLPSTARIKRC